MTRGTLRRRKPTKTMEKEGAREMNALTGLSSFPEIGNRLDLFDEHHVQFRHGLIACLETENGRGTVNATRA